MKITALFLTTVFTCACLVVAQEPQIQENETEQPDTVENENGKSAENDENGIGEEPAEENGTVDPEAEENGQPPRHRMRQERAMVAMGICPVHTLQPQVIPTDDGGVIVVLGNKLVKYDSELNEQQEVTVELSEEEMQALIRQRVELMQMCKEMMEELMPEEGEMQESEQNGELEENGENDQNGEWNGNGELEAENEFEENGQPQN